MAEIFEKYLLNIPPFGEEAIRNALKSLESEDRVDISIKDMHTLKDQINSLRGLAWNTKSHPRTKNKAVVFQKTNAARKFRDITIEIRTQALTKSEQILFLRLASVVDNIIFILF